MKKIVKNFLKYGYVPIDLLNKKEINQIKYQILKKLNNSKRNLEIKNLEFFHNENLTKKDHSFLLKPSKRYINFDKKIFSSKKISLKIRKFLNLYWGHSQYKIFWIGSLKKNEILKDKIGFRVVRPSKKDESGVVHTDAYSDNFDSFITIWIPLVGFNHRYTLRYAKKSHLKLHSKTNQLKQNLYNSKALSKKYIKNFKFTRPILKPGYGIIHHPNILHGDSQNTGRHTRISIEIRIFNTKKYKIREIFNKNFYY